MILKFIHSFSFISSSGRNLKSGFFVKIAKRPLPLFKFKYFHLMVCKFYFPSKLVTEECKIIV